MYLPDPIQLSSWYDRQRTPLRDRGRLGNDPQWVLGFLSCCSWMFPEQVRTCGLRRNSSSLDKTPKMRDSVRLNSWESFSMTLPSIFSETWVIYSSAIPGLSVFCDWLFLEFSGVFLEIASNFLLFHKVPMTLKEKLVSCEDWIDLVFP